MVMEFWIPKISTETTSLSSASGSSAGSASRSKPALPRRLVLPSLSPGVQGEQAPVTFTSRPRSAEDDRRSSGTDGEGDYDDDDELRHSLTLPRIEEVLKDEGVGESSILQQLQSIRKRRDGNDRGLRIKTKLLLTRSTLNKNQGFPALDLERSPRRSGGGGGGGGGQSLMQHRTNTMKIPVNEVVQDDDLEQHATEVAKTSQDHLADYLRDIENIRWLSKQQMESSALGHEFHPPRVAYISTRLPESALLCRAVRSDVVLVYYNYENWSLSELHEETRKALDAYRMGCHARSFMLYCQGGPGFFYLTKHYMMTLQKLQRFEELTQFWKDQGELASKLCPDECTFHFVGTDFTDVEQGQELISALNELVFPNRLLFANPVADAVDAILPMYFNMPKYQLWKDRTST